MRALTTIPRRLPEEFNTGSSQIQWYFLNASEAEIGLMIWSLMPLAI
jgi:hypothetical protein